MYRLIWILFFVFLAETGHTQNGTEPVRVTDLLRIRSVGDLSLSKDGSQALFTVTEIVPEADSKTEYKYLSQVWILGTDGQSVPRRLTGKEGASQPVFSPDGKKIAFIRPVEGKGQIFLLSLEGGEAIQITRNKYGAGNPRWSPDGTRLLFSAVVPFRDLIKDGKLNPGNAVPAWPMEKPGLDNSSLLNESSALPDPDGNMEQVWAYLDQNTKDRKAKVITKLNFLDETDANPDMSFTHFFITEARPESVPVAITRGFFRFSSAEFLPDGKQLILTGNIDTTRHPDRVLEGQVFLVNADGSGLQKILGQPGKTFFNPRVSPSGKWLAFIEGNSMVVEVPALVIMPLHGNANEKTVIPFDRAGGNLEWSADEKYVYFTAASNGGQPLYRAAKDTRKAEQLTDYESGVKDFALAKGKLVMVKTDINSPFELYLADAEAKGQQGISAFNTEWIKTRRISKPEKHSFINEKGMTVEYWVMKPIGFQPGKKYPLLLEIHGGPAVMWGPGETTMWHEYQYFCSKGYGVVYCNPRGSSGYGQDFLRDNINDWGAGPAKDVLTAMDKTVAEGWADTSRLLVTGGSYAGYLVAWIIAHDQRFAAACSQRGVYDLATFFGEGNAWRLVPLYFGGYPWEPAVKATLDRESPINYVDRIRTPYIIFHAENDRRTGVSQSEMLYKSLKVLGRPVEYVRHPAANHEITRSGNNRQRIDQMLRTWEFFERWK